MLLFNRYEYNPQSDLIGKGGFSRVYKALDKKFNRFLALKIYKSSELSERYSPIAEIQRVIELDHPNISRYIDIEEIEKEDSFGQVEKVQVCVMELLEGGNFAKYYNIHKDLVVFKKLLIDVLHGLSYLHRNGIIHRDIKPTNILIKQNLDGPVAKITDFGISKKSDASGDSSSSALIVSIPYMAPEQLNAQKYGIDEKIHYNIDLWSLGVTVYEIITGEVLFKKNEHDSSEQIMTNIVSAELPEKIKLLPEPLNEFVARCIIKDAKDRIKSADELLQLLQPVPPENSEISSGVKETVKELDGINNYLQPPIQAENKNDGITPSNQNFTTTDTDDEEYETTSIDETTEILKPLTQTVNDVENEKPEINDSGDETRVFERPAVEVSVNEPAINENELPTSDETRLFNIPEVPCDPIIQKGVLDNNNIEQEVSKDNGIASLPNGIANQKEEIKTPAISQNEQENNEDARIFTPAETKISPIEETQILATPKNEKEHTKITLFSRYDYYPIRDLIGKGGFSRVYKAMDQKLGRWVALKIYKTSEFSDRYSPIAEIRRVVNLDHANICRYLDIEEIEKTNPFGEIEKIQVCVMELLDSGNFSEYFHKSGKDMELLKKLLQDVLHGISYLHKNGIIHRDIKPANILIKQTIEGPVAKITDFGISKLSDAVNNNSSSALIVSIPYMAPEQLNTKKYGINEKITYNLDLWSLGVTIYEVITGKVLFKNTEQDSSEQIMANIMAPELPEKINELPHPFKNIVSYCVVKNANERAQKAEELLVLLNASQPETLVTVAPLQAIVNALPIIDTPLTSAPEQKEKKQEAPAIVLNTVNEEAVKRRFTIAEPTPEKEKQTPKNSNRLKISIAAAVLLLIIASIIYFKMTSNENKPGNTVLINDTLKNRPAISENSTKKDSINKTKVINTAASDKEEDLRKTKKNDNKEKDLVLIDPEKKKGLTNKIIEANEDKPEKPVISQKYILVVTANEKCEIKKNGSYVGTIRPGKPLKLYLEAGSYTISATSETGGEPKSRNITVTNEQAGKKDSWEIRF